MEERRANRAALRDCRRLALARLQRAGKIETSMIREGEIEILDNSVYTTVWYWTERTPFEYHGILESD
jgi:hypothetical protein